MTIDQNSEESQKGHKVRLKFSYLFRLDYHISIYIKRVKDAKHHGPVLDSLYYIDIIPEAGIELHKNTYHYSCNNDCGT